MVGKAPYHALPPPGFWRSTPEEWHFLSRGRAAALSDAGALGGRCPATCTTLPASISVRAVSTPQHDQPAPAETGAVGSAVAFPGVWASQAMAGEQKLQHAGERVTNFVR